jgi:prepilin-type N-terminal cleavage/methylation domain-containing protein
MPHSLLRPLGMTLTELMATTAMLGLIAALVLGRIAAPYAEGKSNVCHAQRAEIELQVQLWYRQHGHFPAGNLQDIGANFHYFPQGLPTCPVDGAPYAIDTTTGIVAEHEH